MKNIKIPSEIKSLWYLMVHFSPFILSAFIAFTWHRALYNSDVSNIANVKNENNQIRPYIEKIKAINIEMDAIYPDSNATKIKQRLAILSAEKNNKYDSLTTMIDLYEDELFFKIDSIRRNVKTISKRNYHKNKINNYYDKIDQTLLNERNMLNSLYEAKGDSLERALVRNRRMVLEKIIKSNGLTTAEYNKYKDKCISNLYSYGGQILLGVLDIILILISCMFYNDGNFVIYDVYGKINDKMMELDEREAEVKRQEAFIQQFIEPDYDKLKQIEKHKSEVERLTNEIKDK